MRSPFRVAAVSFSKQQRARSSSTTTVRHRRSSRGLCEGYRASTPSEQSPPSHSESDSHALRTFAHGTGVAPFGKPNSDHQSPTSDFRLPTSDFRLTTLD